MINVDHIKDRIDCRDVVERDLGKPKYRSAKYSVYKCPLHNETKGYSLVVYENYWRCFGKCSRGGDVIAWLQEYHNLSFQEACEQLTRDVPPSLRRPRKQLERIREASSEPPGADWQRAAREVVQIAVETLRGKHGKRAWDYMVNQRGLVEDSIARAGLGYIPGGYNEWKTINGLRVPCGITIPWFADNAIWGVKVRRAAGEQRYHQIAGGNIKGCLYLADNLEPGMPILLTEGEFDALIALQVGKGLVCPAAIGSSANKSIHPRWFRKFISAPRILARMDGDGAGERAAAALEGLSGAVKRVQVTVGKDVNDFYLAEGHAAVLTWIKANLEH